MSYRFRARESVRSGVRRIAGEQLGKALEELRTLDPHEAVHQARKRCKKVRAVLRLVRPAAPELYDRENARFRDLARPFSSIRDAEALVETFDALVERFARPLDASALEPLRTRLIERRDERATSGESLREQLGQLGRDLHAARVEAAEWEVPKSGFDAVAGGLRKTYRRARKAMTAAHESPSDAAFHEWRKRVKYHWYHARLLRNIWRKPMLARRGELNQLAELLGDDHDLAVFRRTLIEEFERFDDIDVPAILALVDTRRDELQSEAWTLGKRLLAGKPKGLVRRWRKYWRAWRD